MARTNAMRIAVIGAGVSGLGAAYLLARAHDVTLYEKEQRAGGHVRTIRRDGLALDTGFLVHNEPNYPLLTRLFRELDVRVQPAEMSFSVSCGECGLEWSGRRPFAQPGRAFDVRFLGLLREVARWLRTARRSLEEADYEERTLEEYVAERRYSRRFRDHYLVPLTSALWSTAPDRVLDFPAAYAIRFFDQHRMLGLGRFRWRSVVGGADTYVAAVLDRLAGKRASGRAASARSGALPTACSYAPPTPRSTSSTRSSSPRTPTRRSGCSKIRPRRDAAARRLGVDEERGGLAHRQPVPAAHARPRGPRGTTRRRRARRQRSRTT